MFLASHGTWLRMVPGSEPPAGVPRHKLVCCLRMSPRVSVAGPGASVPVPSRPVPSRRLQGTQSALLTIALQFPMYADRCLSLRREKRLFCFESVLVSYCWPKTYVPSKSSGHWLFLHYVHYLVPCTSDLSLSLSLSVIVFHLGLFFPFYSFYFILIFFFFCFKKSVIP